MTRANRIGVVCIGLATALLVLSGVVRAANVDAAWDNVATKITSSTDCAVAFSIPVAPSPHTVNRNDRAFFYENASWNDTRAANSPTATHRFHLKIQWAVTHQKDAYFNTTTTGAVSGSQQFSLFLDIDAAYTVDITWDGRVFSGSTCDSGVQTNSATVVFQFP